jgi:hypothetical protein
MEVAGIQNTGMCTTDQKRLCATKKPLILFGIAIHGCWITAIPAEMTDATNN